MNIDEYKNIYDNEKSHFFYVSTHRLVISLVKRWLKDRQDLKILDAGCGTGGLMGQLTELGNVCGIDLSPEAVKFSSIRGYKAICASVDKLPFSEESFDLVTSVDVIYHKAVNSDEAALSELRRVLKPNGILILRVPANKFLMSAHDRHVHTARRYSQSELKQKIKATGFMIKQISFVHSPVFALSLAKVFLEKITGKESDSAVEKVPPLLNRFATYLLNLEGKMIAQGVSMPFGQGLVVVAQSKN